MKKRAGQATAVIDAPPDRVFAVITDLRNLPAWNDRMDRVIDAPLPADLADGAEWVVAMKVMGRRFRSRSHVIELDRSERRFSYRSKAEEENPSFAVWTWDVEPAGGGASDGAQCARSRVTVAWELRPVTFVRKRLLSVVRNRQIGRTEAAALLAALAKAC